MSDETVLPTVPQLLPLDTFFAVICFQSDLRQHILMRQPLISRTEAERGQGVRPKGIPVKVAHFGGIKTVREELISRTEVVVKQSRCLLSTLTVPDRSNTSEFYGFYSANCLEFNEKVAGDGSFKKNLIFLSIFFNLI